MDPNLRNLFEKHATDQGFLTVLGESDGWLVFEAHAVQTKVALSASKEGMLLVGTSHRGAAGELAGELEPAPFSLAGFDCFQASNPTELFRVIGRIWSLARALPDDPLTKYKRLFQDTPPTTEVERLHKERVGQDIFRSALLRYWDNACAVTGVSNPSLLRASHIIPWAKCETDAERMNVHNGLLLVANLDAAFDTGLISFADSGEIIISQELKPEDRQATGIDQTLRLKKVSSALPARLKYHRERILK